VELNQNQNTDSKRKSAQSKMRKKSHVSLYQERSVTPKYVKNAFAGGILSRTPLGELTTLPYTPFP